jgi:LysM repeat protein
MRNIRSPYPPFLPARPRQAAPRFAPQPRGAWRSAGARSSAQTRGRLRAWLVAAIFALATAVALAFLLTAGVYGYFLLSGRVLPGVKVGPYAAGSLNRAQLANSLNDAWSHERMLLLTDGASAWPLSPGEAGLTLNAEETAARAFAVGRGEHGLAQMLWLVRFGRIQVEPVIQFDPAAGAAGLAHMTAQVNQPAQDATLRLENGRWLAVPGQNGRSLNVNATLLQIAADPQAVLAQGAIPAVVNPVTPRVNDLTPALAEIEEAARRPLIIEAYDPISDETVQVRVPDDRLAGWLRVEPQDEKLSIQLEGSQLPAFINEWATGLGPDRTLADFTTPGDLNERWKNGEPVTAVIQRTATRYEVEAGDTLSRIAFKVGMPYWKIKQANPEIDPDNLLPGQVLTIPSKNEMLPLPIVRGKRVVISISQQHMWTYENGALRSESIISTGIDRSPTIPGIYQIQTHEVSAYASVWDLTMPHFMGIYQGWPGFMNGIHGLPTLSSGRQLWEGSLGRPVSYGCIILGLEEAENLYNWAEEGVIVEIQP